MFRKRDLDCHTIHQEGLAGGTDPTVLEAAVAEERVLVTLDKDFANVLMYPPESTCGVVVLNLPGRASRGLLAAVLDSFLIACGNQQLRGKLWIVEPGRIREHRSTDEGEVG